MRESCAAAKPSALTHAMLKAAYVSGVKVPEKQARTFAPPGSVLAKIDDGVLDMGAAHQLLKRR